MRLYNSLTRQKENFQPIEPGKVRLYACGETVYDYCHIGHARSMIVFDMIVRYFRLRGFDVTYVRNITDVDDKIIKRAHENNESCESLTTRFIAALKEDMAALHLAPPSKMPCASQHIPEIIALIQALIESGHAYLADNGDVCFEVRRFKSYGRLSNRDVDQLRSGSRIDVKADKRDPLDFVLWKPAKAGEPEWDSPWGKGRPGWHIECSAMSTKLLGQPFDIHGGGLDLKFPHHENEIAQSEAIDNTAFAHYWMHAGLLTINGEKMSKSLNNFFTIREVLAVYHPEVVRYFMLSGHYRSPLNYAKETLSTMVSGLNRLYVAVRGLPDAPAEAGEFAEKLYAVMDDDFNTPQAFSILFDMAREINRLREQNDVPGAARLASALKEWGALFGILQEDPEQFLQGDESLDIDKIEALIAERNHARATKDWATADRVRDELKAMQIVIEDGDQGTTWRKAH